MDLCIDYKQAQLPFDPDLFHELNLERYELSKSGKLLFNHPHGTHDDRFWALARAAYAAEQVQPMGGSIARTVWRASPLKTCARGRYMGLHFHPSPLFTI